MGTSKLVEQEGSKLGVCDTKPGVVSEARLTSRIDMGFIFYWLPLVCFVLHENGKG